MVLLLIFLFVTIILLFSPLKINIKYVNHGRPARSIDKDLVEDDLYFFSYAPEFPTLGGARGGTEGSRRWYYQVLPTSSFLFHISCWGQLVGLEIF